MDPVPIRNAIHWNRSRIHELIKAPKPDKDAIGRHQSNIDRLELQLWNQEQQ